jgi:hypothetical protein
MQTIKSPGNKALPTAKKKGKRFRLKLPLNPIFSIIQGI